MTQLVRSSKGRESSSHQLTNDEKCSLIEALSDWFYDHTDSFRGALGVQLSYLYPAIIKGHQIEVSKNSAIVQLLKRNKIPDYYKVWAYIDIVG